MKWSQIKAVLHKELIELWRSPLTLMIMLLTPGIVLPVLLLSSNDMAMDMTSRIESVNCRVVMGGQSDLLTKALAKTKKVEVMRNLTAEQMSTPAKKLIARGDCDAVVLVPPKFDEQVTDYSGCPQLQLIFDSRIERSLLGEIGLIDALFNLKEKIFNKRLEEKGLKQYQPPFEIVDLDAHLDKTNLPHRLSVSYILLLFFSVFVAATSVSVDLVTGERERNTLEALLLTPLSRESIMAGKLLVVFAFTIICALLTTVTFTAKVLLGHMTPLSADQLLWLIAQCFPLVAIMALTTSSIMVLTCSYARSIQQATGYAFWVLIWMLVPAGAAASGDVNLSSGAVFFPVGNLSIALTDICRGRAEWGWIALASAVSLFYCWVFTQPIPGFLKREEQLFNLEVSPGDRVAKGRWLQEVVLLFSVVFLLMFYVSPLAVSWKPLLGLAITQIVCVLLPAVLFLWFFKLPLKKTVHFGNFNLRRVAGAAFMAPATTALCSLIATVQGMFLPAPEDFFKQLMNVIIPPGAPLPMVLLTAALAPGVCEEFLFRGVILGLLWKRVRPVKLCLGVGLAFGVFHFSVFRFLPTGILGVALTGMVVISDSIFPSMVLHMSHNALSVMLYLHPSLAESTLNWAIAAVSGLFGAWLFLGGGNKKTVETSS